MSSGNEFTQSVVNENVNNTRPVISIKGARANNLKNINIDLPKNTLIVISGVSGSGKSSLAIDTLYAEGQRRYVESLSSYARQFMSRMKKPEVDTIKGICPAIAVDQKVSSGNVRSTVGSMTEINEYLRLLYARIGKTISPISGNVVKKQEVFDVIDFIKNLPTNTRCLILSPLPKKQNARTLFQELTLLLQKGYNRMIHKNQMVYIEDLLQSNSTDLQLQISTLNPEDYYILVDRFMIQPEQKDEAFMQRVADSVKTAFDESGGYCIIQSDEQFNTFSTQYEMDGMSFVEPEPNLFNPNNSFGACPICEGYGKVIGISEDKVVPDKSLSVYEGAIVPWRGESGQMWKTNFITYVQKIDFPIHRSYEHLNEHEKKLLWEGDENIEGIQRYFKNLEEKTYKIQNRVILARYRGKTTCHACKGSKLRPEASYVKINGKSINDLFYIPVQDLLKHLDTLLLDENDAAIAERLLTELKLRLSTMCKIGLNYLSIDRPASTLSGGEAQRINLTRTLSSNLTASLYILDEPSIGLHPRDTDKLIEVLFQLRDLGNTVVLVEHDEEIIRKADYLIDIGPAAGRYGGQVVFQGNFRKADPSQHKESMTVQYLHQNMHIPTNHRPRKSSNHIVIKGARAHNLKNIDVTIPLQTITVVTGVSGSGKSTLIKHGLVEGIQQMLAGAKTVSGENFKEFTGDKKQINLLEFISQNPMGKSSRSNPVTYVKAFDYIRDLFTKQQLSKIRGYKPKHFSFNVEGGRCELCKGEGQIIVEMQFLADVPLPCEACNSKRFKKEILEVEFNGFNIYDVLDMSIEDSIEFFKKYPEIVDRIKPLNDVGLGYLKLGQSSSTLSGGEAQRVKLASYLGNNQLGKILFIFDEPTTGLHLHDIQKLLNAFNALVEKGHSVIIVEHHIDVIKNADYVIDLGPEAGIDGGYLLYQGPPQGLIEIPSSHTGKYLALKYAEEKHFQKTELQ